MPSHDAPEMVHFFLASVSIVCVVQIWDRDRVVFRCRLGRYSSGVPSHDFCPNCCSACVVTFRTLKSCFLLTYILTFTYSVSPEE